MSGRAGGDATRQRILVESSILFTRRGFHGTGTLDIAAAVGIRQPSVFHNFENKQAILAALLDAELDPLIERLRRAIGLDAPWSVRLYAHLMADVLAVLEIPFDVRGLYNDDVLAEAEFAPQRTKREDMHKLLRRLVRGGIKDGDLAGDVSFLQQAITGLMIETMWVRGAQPAPHLAPRAEELADFVLRGALVDVGRLDEVRRHATTLVRRELNGPPN